MAGKTLNISLVGSPSEKQDQFMMAKTLYVGYGGARGGGKSWALRRKLVILALNNTGIRILLIRRTLAELRENHTLLLQIELKNIAKYKDDEKSFTFPNGSRLKLGYCDSEGDVLQYQGQEYDIIGLDEATQFTEWQYDCIRILLRGGNPLHPKRIYLTCNPGGVGHAWVKRLFIDKDYQDKEKAEDYTFIQALADDNPHNGADYIQMLDSLPFEQREAWRYGKWNSFAGQYFSEWNEDIHTCGAREIKPYWRKYMTIDYGLDMFAALWIAIDEYFNAYVYREIMVKNCIVSDSAKLIKEAEQSEPINQKIIRYAPPDLWARKSNTGQSTIDIFRDNGLHFSKADNSREAGWYKVKEWLNIIENDGKKSSKIKIVRSSCPNLCKCLPLLQFDKHKTNDCSTEPHDITHITDAFRYFGIMRPCPAKKPQENINHTYDFERPKQNGLLGGQAGRGLLGGSMKI